jgi:hypothetical protein
MLAAVRVLFERQCKGLTQRPADAAAPRASVGGNSAQSHTPAVAVGRRRRAADAIVRQHGEIG